MSFLKHGLHHLWQIVCSLSFHSAAFERGERGGASFGPAAADGSKFSLSRWSQGRIEPPNSEGGAGFAFFAQKTEVSVSPCNPLNSSLLSCSILILVEKLRCSGRISSIL